MSPQLAQLFGTIPAGTQYESSSNQLTARFVSDLSINYPGFSIQFTQTTSTIPQMTTPVMIQCPASNYTGPSGSIASPNYPGRYGNNMNCNYYISVVAGMAVQLTFDVFSTEERYDIVTIFDGTNANASIIDTLSGTAGRNRTFTGTTNSMRVNFQSDSSAVENGFHANYVTAMPLTTTTTTLRPITTASPRCGINWYYEPITNKCYHYEYTQLSFDDAAASCISINSTLLSIHNMLQENVTAAYVIYSVPDGFNRFYTWIGLKAVQGQFQRWVDGTAIDYTAWEPGQPNLASGQCVALQAWQQIDKPNGWRSLDCSYQRPYLCLKNPTN
jgi:hypothetical protein